MKAHRIMFEAASRMRLRLRGVMGSPLPVLALCVTLVTVFAVAAQAIATHQAVRDLQHDVRSRELSRSPTTRPAPRPDTALAEDRKTWDDAASRLNIPWPALLAALEEVTPAEVAMVSIEPEASRSSFKLVAESASLDALLAYAGALRASPRFSDVMPVKHETLQDANRPFRLALEVWPSKPAGPLSRTAP